MAQLLHLSIRPKKGVTRERVEGILNLAVDWYRYGEGLYVLYTTSNPRLWHKRLINLVRPSGHLFICQLDIMKRGGFMEHDFWEWLHEKQARAKRATAK
jgi:hypothetical protein